MRAILTYHSIDTSGSVISIAPEVFARHVRWLTSGRVAVVPLADLLSIPGDRDAVALTFDDGFTNFRCEAWPQLKDAGLPVTLFVPTAFVGRTNAWSALPQGGMPSLPILDWPALRRLQEDGVTLGAHSRTHADLQALSGDALRDEVAGSCEDILRETGRAPVAFAYPYGFWNMEAASMVRTVCRYACTTELRLLGRSEEPCLLPRLDAFYLKRPGRLETFGGASFRRFIAVRSRLRQLRHWLRTRPGPAATDTVKQG